MEHLGYKNLNSLKDLSSKMDFKETVLKKLYEDCQKKN